VAASRSARFVVIVRVNGRLGVFGLFALRERADLLAGRVVRGTQGRAQARVFPIRRRALEEALSFALDALEPKDAA
jgi:hypothetical protein